jgi:hypothetical protein
MLAWKRSSWEYTSHDLALMHKESRDTSLLIPAFDRFAVREIVYSMLMSTRVFDPSTRSLVLTDSFTGVPRPRHAFMNGRAQDMWFATDLMSPLTVKRFFHTFRYEDSSVLVRAFASFLVQGLFVMASMEAQGILHRDIKGDHLAIASDGSFALIDWGLSTRHVDNCF